MNQLKTPNVEFGPIKLKEMKSLEKIDYVIEKNINPIEARILIKVICLTVEQPIVISFQELSDYCKLKSKQMLSIRMKELLKHGMIVKKLSEKLKYEISFEIPKNN